MLLYEELKNSSGNQFQTVFTALMKSKYGHRYQSTATYGNVGDMGVDGVLNGCVAFAVYAPEIYNDDKVIAKIRDDFSKFITYRQRGDWSGITKYCFVIKYARNGMTSRVINLVQKLGEQVSTEILTLGDLKRIENGYLPFSDDDNLFEEFKSDFARFGEYAVKTDFTAEPIEVTFPDEISSFVDKWSSVRRIFKDAQREETKRIVISLLDELLYYLGDKYIHLRSDGESLIFRSDNRDGIVDDMRPNVLRIREELASIMSELYYSQKK